MSEIPFHETRMGRIFYEVTLPSLVQQLMRIANDLERLADAADKTDMRDAGVVARDVKDKE